MEKIWVKVPSPSDPALRGRAILRRPGPRRRVMETPEEIALGLVGAPVKKVRSMAGYFTEEPEEVELTRWVRRKLVTGALVQAEPPGRTARSKPVAAQVHGEKDKE